jgi:acetyl esterase/lipase
MPLAWDNAVMSSLAPLLAAGAGTPPPPVGDVAGRRAATAALLESAAAEAPDYSDITVEHRETTGHDGAVVPLRIYRQVGEDLGSVHVYFHGGGMILGSLDMYDTTIKAYVAQTGVPVVAPDYRLAPEHPYPTPVEDCYAALTWTAEHAAELEIDPERIVVGGDSAGGNLAAAVALMARDRGGPRLAAQMLVYPMLDDRTATPDPGLGEMLTWSYDDNITGWQAYLGDAYGTENVPAYAAPARATDLAGLPRTFLDVGGNDIFRDEDIDYAARLWRAGVPTDAHVYPGGPHAYETLAGDTQLAKRTLASRYAFLRTV